MGNSALFIAAFEATLAAAPRTGMASRSPSKASSWRDWKSSSSSR